MGKFSKKYNQDSKQIKHFLDTYHSCWESYAGFLEELQYGQFESVSINILTDLEDLSIYKNQLFQSNIRVKKIFLKKWIKKYGKHTDDPFELLIFDFKKILQSISTRKMFLKRNKV